MPGLISTLRSFVFCVVIFKFSVNLLYRQCIFVLSPKADVFGIEAFQLQMESGMAGAYLEPLYHWRGQEIEYAG